MRKIEFRGKAKDNNWYYGDLITVNNTDGSIHYYIIANEYSDRDNGMANAIRLDTCNSPEIDEKTLGQYIGTNEYGKIYEGMKLYDEYQEDYCKIEYDKTDCNYVLVYYEIGLAEKLENLRGLQIIEEEE